MVVDWGPGGMESHQVWLSARSDELRFPTRGELKEITLDPSVILLMEEVEATP